MTPYGKKLLLAKDAAEFKRLLGISSEGIWDEGQTRWQGTAYTSTAESYTGYKSLHLAGMNLQTTAPVTFGGDPFTISFAFYLNSSANSSIFRALGTTRSFGFNIKNTHLSCDTGTTAASTQQKAYTSPATGRWHAAEISYESGKLYFKLNGSSQTVNLSVIDEPRRLIFGAFNGYVDDFELVDNGVTLSKLNFEQVTL